MGRECALQILYQVELNPSSLKEASESFWSEHANVAEESRLFAEKILNGTREHMVEIDAVIVKATENWELSRMAVVDRNILRFATYELLYLADVPPKVTINEAVNIAKKFSQEESGKFVNGVLDRIKNTEKPRHASAE